jgi:hypothetical protein
VTVPQEPRNPDELDRKDRTVGTKALEKRATSSVTVEIEKLTKTH